MTYEEKIASYKDIKKVNEEMTLCRNSSDEFYRILRRKFNGENANTETYGVKLDYKGNIVTPEYFKAQYEELKNNSEFRFRPKNDREKTNISDAPGFGSVRLSPPFEEPNFDREYFEFIDNVLVRDGDNVIDYGGGMSPFLAFLKNPKTKRLIDKCNTPEVFSQFGIKYTDADEYLKIDRNVPDVFFSFHTIEHTNNPEELITIFSHSDVFVFATPNEEIIDTSIYHHIFMQKDIFKKIFTRNKSVAFMRMSRGGNLDIHGIVFNSIEKYNRVKDNLFFNRNFKLYTELEY